METFISKSQSIRRRGHCADQRNASSWATGALRPSSPIAPAKSRGLSRAGTDPIRSIGDQYVNRIRKPVYTRMRRLVAQIKVSADSLDSLHFAVEWHQRNTGESNLLGESNEPTSSPLLGIVSFQQWNERTGEAQLGYILDRPFGDRGWLQKW